MVLGCAALVGSIGVFGVEPPEPYSHVLISDRVDGVHADLAADLAPIEVGPVTVTLTSPSHSIEVLEHQLLIGFGESGADTARVKARYQGKAKLIAELEIGGVASEIEDEIELPLQETEIAGLIEIARDGDGYRVTVLEAPEHVEIQIESNLAGQLGMLCRGFAVLSMGNVDCEAVDQAMSRLRVPLPEPGEEYLVAREALTEGELEQLESYLRDREN